MALRFRSNFIYGVASGVLANAGQVTITGTGWPTNIPGGYYMPVVLNPGYYGTAANPEVVYITGATSTVATVTRQQEGSSLTNGTTVPWVAGPLISDFTLSSGIANGDFPAPTGTGQIFLSVGTNSGTWGLGSNTTGQFLLSTSGGNPVWSTTIPASAVSYTYYSAGAGSVTLPGGDVNGIVQISGAGGGSTTIILPSGSTVSYGQQITFFTLTSGQVVFNAAAGNTIISTGASGNGAFPVLRASGSAATAIWVGGATNTPNGWLVTGDII